MSTARSTARGTARTAVRALAVTTAAAALTLTAGASAATADPALSWTVISGAGTGGMLDATVYTAALPAGPRAALTARRAATAVDASDDGRVTAYTTQRRVPGANRPRVGLTLVVDGRTRVVGGRGFSGQPDVSPDGTGVTIGRADGSVVRVDVASGARTRLCGPCVGFRPTNPLRPRAANVALSPDGAYVAVRAWTDGDAEALVIHRTSDGARVARRTMGEGEPDVAMAWTPDSRHVAYVALDDLGAPDFDVVWRVGLLSIEGTDSATLITVPAEDRLSGPMRVGAQWYLVRTSGTAPSGRRATVLRTDALTSAPTTVGVVTTRGPSRDLPYVGTWTVTGAAPAPLE